VANTGLDWNPGQGVVVLDAGTQVFSLDMLELLNEGGLDRVFHGFDVQETLCT
jgi:hypothetical protein